jgi:DNA-directed RNA polymerase
LFDFKKALQSKDKAYVNYIKKIILYCLDFTNLEPFESILLDMDNYIISTRKLEQRIRSYKIQFNELLFQICLILPFKFFYFSHFMDGRGRIYPICML